MTRVVAIAMVKDEADIIGHTLEHMLGEVDAVIVADNGSTDDTRDILESLRQRGDLVIIDDDDPAYRQSEKMTALAEIARTGQGADWIVPFDADEMWSCSNVIYDIDEYLTRSLPAGIQAVAASLFDHVAVGPDNNLEWRTLTALAMPKMACRAHPDLVIHQGNHSVTYGGRPPRIAGGLTVHHFPYRSEDQFVRKVRNGAAAYKAAGDTVRADYGAHWRQWGQILDRDGEEAVRAIFRTWYHRDDPSTPFQIDGTWLNALVWDPVL